MKPKSALKAMTVTPAALVAMSDRLGKIAPGMLGNLVIADGDLFNKKTRIVETWVDGRRFESDKPPAIDVRGSWQLEVSAADDRVLKLTLKITGTAKQPAGILSKVVEEGQKAEEIRLGQITLTDSQLNFRLEGKSLGKEGPVRASAIVSADEGEKLSLLGKVVWADGT